MHAGPWISAYVFAILVWSFVLAAGKSPILWRGSSLLVLNGAFILASVVTMLTRREITLGLVAFDVVLLGLVLAVGDIWILLHVDVVRVEQVLEGCFTRTRAKYVRAGRGYVLSVAENEISVKIGRPIAGAMRLAFSGNTRSKKAELIRALIVKQFGGSFPAPRMRA